MEAVLRQLAILLEDYLVLSPPLLPQRQGSLVVPVLLPRRRRLRLKRPLQPRRQRAPCLQPSLRPRQLLPVLLLAEDSLGPLLRLHLAPQQLPPLEGCLGRSLLRPRQPRQLQLQQPQLVVFLAVQRHRAIPLHRNPPARCLAHLLPVRLNRRRRRPLPPVALLQRPLLLLQHLRLPLLAAYLALSRLQILPRRLRSRLLRLEVLRMFWALPQLALPHRLHDSRTRLWRTS